MPGSTIRIRIQNDPYIQGSLITNQQVSCGYCCVETICIKIDEVTLPDEVKPAKSLIAYDLADPPKPVPYLGIACGCYAKFQRQLAHIMSKRVMKK